MEFRDYYGVLGVARDATAPAIKRAYRALARKYHPDVSKAPDAEQRMQEINEAYAVLSDPEKRAAYDRLGGAYQPGQDFQPPPDWDAGVEFRGRAGPHGRDDFSDFFAAFFGRMGSGRPRGTFGLAGEDHHARILLDLEDSYRAPTRDISLHVPRIDPDGHMRLKPHRLEVRIPRGIRPGQVIRLAGQGAPGQGGGPPGDLLLEVGFKPHPVYRIEGSNLHRQVPVAPWEAALGTTLELTLPDSRIAVRIPAGGQSGQTLRVRGKGLPATPPGDLWLELRVVLPPADSPRAREIYEAMARALPFNPRSG